MTGERGNHITDISSHHVLSAQHDGKEFTMGKIYKNVTEAIGGTPLVELCNMEKKYGLERRSWRSWNI